MAQYRTVLTIVTDEPVTPDHLARRIAEAAGTGGALRPGEGILLPSDPRTVLRVTDCSMADVTRDSMLAAGTRPEDLPSFLQPGEERPGPPSTPRLTPR